MNEKFYEWVDGSDNIVFLGGAGVSTESGLKDFRGLDGFYRQKFDYPPEVILSRSFFENNTEYFMKFYTGRMLFLAAQPNAAHKKLAELEKAGKLKAVVTQNIDGLHTRAGSQNVLEIHGCSYRNYCMDCKKQYDVEFVVENKGVPRCTECGGIVRPDVVLYEEPIDQEVLKKAQEYIANADMLIVGGTSLNVFPAAGLIRHYKGNKMVIINQTETQYDGVADMVIHEPIGEVLDKIVVKP